MESFHLIFKSLTNTFFMDLQHTEYNNDLLKKIVYTLVNSIDLIGKKSTSEQFSEKKLLKHALLDLSKQIYANMHALNTLIPDFHVNGFELKRIPIALVSRGAIVDCQTGLYLISFINSDQSLKNEIDAMSLAYAKFLHTFQKEKLQYLENDEKLISQKLRQWEISFKSNYGHLFKSRVTEKWDFKNVKDLRVTSEEGLKNDLNGKITEAVKYNRIKEFFNRQDYTFLYTGFGYFSQYQHYSFANRKMLEDPSTKDEFFGILLTSISAIWIAMNQFSSILGGQGNEEEIKRNNELIKTLYSSIK